MAFEWLIESRGGGAVVRVVHSGLLGENWEAEYNGLSAGLVTACAPEPPGGWPPDVRRPVRC
jgi:hypothetical protein